MVLSSKLYIGIAHLLQNLPSADKRPATLEWLLPPLNFIISGGSQKVCYIPWNGPRFTFTWVTNYANGKPHMLTTSPDTGADNWWLVGDNWSVAIGWWQLAAPTTQIRAAQKQMPHESQRHRGGDPAAPGRTSDPGEHQSAAPATQIQSGADADVTQITAEKRRRPAPWRTPNC